MPLLPLERFAPLLNPLLGKRVGYVRPIGNTGDRLIDMATFQMFAVFGVRWRMAAPEAVDDCDELVFGGGGNMGRLYPSNWELRSACLATGLPLTIFPQSFTSPEDRTFSRLYVRERLSLGLRPDAILAPDMALGLAYRTTTKERRGRGVFLRRDGESLQPRSWLRRTRRDPARLCRTPTDYLELAAEYSEIITDRLHFAIAGLIVGRRVTLVGNSYFKNAAMHQAWLEALGCQFAASWSDGDGLLASHEIFRWRKWMSHAPSSQLSTLPNM